MAKKRTPFPSLFSSPVHQVQETNRPSESSEFDFGVWLENGELVSFFSARSKLIDNEAVELFYAQLFGRIKVDACRIVRFSHPVPAQEPWIDVQTMKTWDVFDEESQVLANFTLSPTLSLRFQALVKKAVSAKKKNKSIALEVKPISTKASVAVPAPAFDPWGSRLIPQKFDHDDFSFRTYATTVAEGTFEDRETVQGWRACFEKETESPAFLVRVVPKKGKVPSEGWMNILAYALAQTLQVRVAKINLLPQKEALSSFAAWEYKVGAGPSESNLAFWDVQILPSKRLLSTWSGVDVTSWENTFRLKFLDLIPSAAVESVPATTVFDVYGRLFASDAKKFVQNFLLTLGTDVWTRLFYYLDFVGSDNDRTAKERVASVFPAGEKLLRLWMPKTAIREWEQRRKSGPWPTYGELLVLHREVMAILDERIAEGAFEFSLHGQEVWNKLYRFPIRQSFQKRILEIQATHSYDRIFSEENRVISELMRLLDVTDLAIVLRTAQDRKWRQFVTANRELDIKAELEFVESWVGRGELTPEREWDAWNQWKTRWEELRDRFSLL